jgi:hypothetical protein
VPSVLTRQISSSLVNAMLPVLSREPAFAHSTPATVVSRVAARIAPVTAAGVFKWFAVILLETAVLPQNHLLRCSLLVGRQCHLQHVGDLEGPELLGTRMTGVPLPSLFSAVGSSRRVIPATSVAGRKEITRATRVPGWLSFPRAARPATEGCPALATGDNRARRGGR